MFYSRWEGSLKRARRRGGRRCRGRARCLRSKLSPIECQGDTSLSTGHCALFYRPCVRWL